MQNKPFRSILPVNSTPLEKALEQACAERLAAVDINIAEIYSPDDCPAVFLPWLASAYRVPYWDVNWTEEERRESIKLSLRASRKKGVPWAVKTALKIAHIDAQLIEWWQTVTKGAPYTFTTRVWLNNQPAGLFGDAAVYPRLHDIVNDYKNVRSHYDLRVGAKFTQHFSLGLAASMHATANQRADTLPVPIRDSAISIAPRIATSMQAAANQRADTLPVPIRDSALSVTTRIATSMHATANQKANTAPVPIRTATPRIGVQIGMLFRATMTLGAA